LQNLAGYSKIVLRHYRKKPMPNLIQLTEDEWFEQFKPIPNHLDENASFNDGEQGYMFETYGDEVEFVKSQDSNRIWTYSDGDDGGTYISDGYHVVNRIGYFVTTVPYDDKQYYQIQLIAGKDD
jgi:hypothetical protein